MKKNFSILIAAIFLTQPTLAAERMAPLAPAAEARLVLATHTSADQIEGGLALLLIAGQILVSTAKMADSLDQAPPIRDITAAGRVSTRDRKPAVIDFDGMCLENTGGDDGQSLIDEQTGLPAYTGPAR